MLPTFTYPFQSCIYQHSLSSLLLCPEGYYWSLANTGTTFFSSLLILSSLGQFVETYFGSILFHISFSSYPRLCLFSLDLFPSLRSIEMWFCWVTCWLLPLNWWTPVIGPFLFLDEVVNHPSLLCHSPCPNPLSLFSDALLVFFPYNFLASSMTCSSLIMLGSYCSCYILLILFSCR